MTLYFTSADAQHVFRCYCETGNHPPRSAFVGSLMKRVLQMCLFSNVLGQPLPSVHIVESQTVVQGAVAPRCLQRSSDTEV